MRATVLSGIGFMIFCGDISFADECFQFRGPFPVTVYNDASVNSASTAIVSENQFKADLDGNSNGIIEPGETVSGDLLERKDGWSKIMFCKTDLDDHGQPMSIYDAEVPSCANIVGWVDGNSLLSVSCE